MSIQEALQAEQKEIVQLLDKSNALLFKALGLSETCKGCGDRYKGEDLCFSCKCSSDCGCAEEASK